MASTEDQAPREAVLDAAGDAQSRTFAVGSDEGEARWWFGGLATIKATKEQTGGHYTLVEVLEPEGEGSLHVHYREDEGFWVLEGQLTFEVGEEIIKAGPGSFVFGPKDVPHRFIVESGPARLLFILSPAGFEEFVYATSEPAKEHALPPKARPVRRRWSTYEPSLASTEASCSSRAGRRSAEGGRSSPPP
jgi:mannose-6-phosphate isomerase-like protein (cupin superfamily)